ncbi:MAG: ABC transporter ATP-binding protein [Gammaproteobacteria bacterium]|nr:MAG: ABC transporter ATP-binding protein [Gammaproteobacteria bacterium]
MSNLIVADRLTRYYGDHCAVDEVSFTLKKGEILGFLGPNGAGKSTTMKMICGNLAPTDGAISINGIDLLERPKQAKAELGYLPETPPVYRELTVNEYLDYCGKLHGLKRAALQKATLFAKERCGLIEVANRLIGNLSKGFQQRTGIAQAILHSPAVIVLDEPTVGLDPIQIREIRSLIRDLGEEHGIILSTHILPEVEESCTHVQIIRQGKLVLNDSIATLKKQLAGSSFILATSKEIEGEFLQSIEGVNTVETLKGCRYRIHFDNQQNPAEMVAEKVIQSGYGLRALTPEQRSMEALFLEVTRGEEG